jgi:hypothetical protein
MTINKVNFILIYLFLLHLCGCSTTQTNNSILKLEETIKTLETIQVLGNDKNKNLIRDDMEIFIESLHITNLQKKLSKNYARDLQQLLQHSQSTEECKIIIKTCASVSIAKQQLEDSTIDNIGSEIADIIQSEQLNTTIRKQSFKNFNNKAKKCLNKATVN